VPTEAQGLLDREMKLEIPQQSNTETKTGVEMMVEDKFVKPSDKIRNVEIKAKLDWRRWQEFYDAIIEPLISEGSEIEIDMSVKAHSEDGIGKDIVEDRIKENLHALRVKSEVDAS
jgi:hypothetical protein